MIEIEKSLHTEADKSREARSSFEATIARLALAREENIFLLLSIFIGVISGLLVVSFRIAIEWLSVLLLGSSPNPHQPRLIYIPALAGLVIAVLTRFVFPECSGQWNQPDESCALHSQWLYLFPHSDRQVSAVGTGDRERALAGTGRSVAADRRWGCVACQPQVWSIEGKTAYLCSDWSSSRIGCGFQCADLRNPLCH